MSQRALITGITGMDVTIKEATEIVARVVGYAGSIERDSTKPDGMPRKLLDVSKATGLGWKAKIGLEEGVRDAYEWCRENETTARK